MTIGRLALVNKNLSHDNADRGMPKNNSNPDFAMTPDLATLDLKQHIRSVPDFPKPGILFYDVATLLANGTAWQAAVTQMDNLTQRYHADYIAGIDARGFLFAGALADRRGCGILLARKKGKLPGEVIEHAYTLEYGSNVLEAQIGMFEPGARILIVDDLLATGGTLAATVTLFTKLGGQVVAAATLVELVGLGGRDLLEVPYEPLLQYEI